MLPSSCFTLAVVSFVEIKKKNCTVGYDNNAYTFFICYYILPTIHNRITKCGVVEWGWVSEWKKGENKSREISFIIMAKGKAFLCYFFCMWRKIIRFFKEKNQSMLSTLFSHFFLLLSSNIFFFLFIHFQQTKKAIFIDLITKLLYIHCVLCIDCCLLYVCRYELKQHRKKE